MSRVVAITVGRVLNAASSVVAVRLYTELLKPEQVGKLSLLLSSVALFNLFLVAPVSSYVTQKAIGWHAAGSLVRKLKKPLLYSFLSSGFAVLVSIGLIRAGLFAASMLVAPLMGLAVLGTGLSGFGSQIFNYLGHPVKYVVLSVITSWVGVAAAGFLCFVVGATAESWMAGTVAAQVFVGFLAIILIVRTMVPAGHILIPVSGGSATGFDLWAIALYSAPMLVATCLSWVQTDGYRYFFAHMVDERTLGLFAAGLAVGISPMLLLEKLLNDTYLPILARAIALKGREHWPLSWDVYASACILPLVLFTMLACSGTSFFAMILVSHAYYAVAWLGAFGCLAKCLQMMSSLYVGFSYAALETTHLVRPYLIGAAVTVSCIFMLRALPPFIGFGLSLIAGAAAALVANAWAALVRYNLRFPYFAFARALALGLPIVGVNFAGRFLLHVQSTAGAVVLLACDTLYMAGLCWFYHPNETEGGSQSPGSRTLAVAQA